MKRWLIIVFFALLIAPSCNVYKEVEVSEVKEVRIIRFDQDAVEAEVELVINNPNWYRVVLLESDVDVFINGKEVGKLQLKEKVILANKTSSTRTIVMTGDYDEISSGFLDNLLTLLFANTAKFEVIGTMKGRALMISRKVDVKEETELDINQFRQ